MAFNEYATIGASPLELGSDSDRGIIWGTGAPDGDTSPQSDAAKGSLYIRTDAGTDEASLYLKVDTAGSDDDWAVVLIAGEVVSGGRTWGTDWTMGTDKKLYFRDSAIYIYSSGDGVLQLVADTSMRLGDGTNEARFAADGEITLAGTAMVTRALRLDLDSQHGTATSEAFQGAPSINLDTDTETWYVSFKAPNDWDAASDLTLVCMVGNEIAEDDGDDVSFTGQVRGYADGETMSNAGQAVTFALNLTGGDQAINVVNRVTGTIAYADGTYPIAAGDTVVVKMIVNLGTGTECTGPLHVVAQWIEYRADKLGTAT